MPKQHTPSLTYFTHELSRRDFFESVETTVPAPGKYSYGYIISGILQSTPSDISAAFSSSLRLHWKGFPHRLILSVSDVRTLALEEGINYSIEPLQ